MGRHGEKRTTTTIYTKYYIFAGVAIFGGTQSLLFLISTCIIIFLLRPIILLTGGASCMYPINVSCQFVLGA